MPAPTLMDLNSGMDTRGTIKKLLELERIPIRRLEQKNKLNEIRISAWEQVRRRTKKLESRSRALHSFSGAFAVNSVKSSDPGAITGQAAPNVHPGKQQIEVKQLATFHALHSDSLPSDEALPAGKFQIEVNGKKIDFSFRGGKPRAFLNFLKSRAASILDANGVKMDAKHLMIALRSKSSGKKGEIRFTDPDGLLKKVGFLGAVETKKAVEKTTDIRFDKKSLQVLAQNSSGRKAAAKQGSGASKAKATKETPYEILDGGRALRLYGNAELLYSKKLSAKAKLRFHYELALLASETKDPNNPNNKKDSTKEGPTNSKKKEGSRKEEQEKFRETQGMEIGPEIEVRVGDVRLKGYNLKRRPLSKPGLSEKEASGARTEAATEKPGANSPAVLQIGVSWKENGKFRHAAIAKKIEAQSVEFQKSREGVFRFSVASLTGGKPATAIYLSLQNAKAVLSRAKITDTKTKRVTKAKNETTPARDAIVRINGVEVKRSKNQGLSDIIEGVSLDLNRKTNGPVTVSIETRSDEIIKEIEAWIQAYNDLLVFCRELSKNAKNDLKPAVGPDGRPIVDKKQSGIFASDSTIRQLMTRIRMNTARSFPVVGRDGYRVLSDIGITSGAIGQDWEDIKTGILTLDKAKLRSALAGNPEGVRNLFASDTNEDNIKDDGLAIQMVKTLRPYNRRAGGLIAIRIQMLRDRIKGNKDDIYRKELAVKNKEDSLRRKFGYMERAVKHNRSLGEYLSRQNRQGNN